MDVVLTKSKQKNKKYAVKVGDKTVNFGAEGYEDYTTHKDKSRMDRYVKRHKDNEDWTKKGIETSGFWAKHILWNQPSLESSIKDTERKFNLKIRRK
jgi:hypothetical protein